MSEIWKYIKGTNKDYKVSNKGRVISYKYNRVKELSDFKDTPGYRSVVISINGNSKIMRISRLVAKHFIPNPDNKPEVNHINGDKTDDRVGNLEWVTSQENVVHAFEEGLRKPPKGEGHGMSKLTEDEVKEIIYVYKNDPNATYKMLANRYSVSFSCIGQIIRGEKWSYLQT